MSNIVRDSDIVELVNPPKFEFGEKVRSLKVVRNDGTFSGKDIGDLLVKKGDIGYITSIGTFLQQFYIYGVDFPERGYRVGMRGKELVSVDYADEEETAGAVVDETADETTNAGISPEIER